MGLVIKRSEAEIVNGARVLTPADVSTEAAELARGATKLATVEEDGDPTEISISNSSVL